jgi:hypothetical protein
MQINNSIFEILAVPIQWFKVVNALVYSHLGFWGQLAFDLLLLYLLITIVPSLVLSYVSSYFLPFSLSIILPVCVMLMIAINVAMS